eukprot:gene7908-15761_t
MLREYEDGKRRTQPRLPQKLVEMGMSPAVLQMVSLITPVLHVILGTQRTLLGALPAHVPVEGRPQVLRVFRETTHNNITEFSAEKLTGNMSGAKVRRAVSAHTSMFTRVAATGTIKCAFDIASELNGALYSPSMATRDALATYALVLWTYVAHLAPGALSKLYAHELVCHIAEVADLPVPSIFLSDDRGEAAIRYVVQCLRGGSHDWKIHTGQVLEWWHAQNRDAVLPSGGRPVREPTPPKAVHLPPCMFALIAKHLGVWVEAGVPLGVADATGAVVANPAADGGALMMCGCMVPRCEHRVRMRSDSDAFTPLPADGLRAFLARDRPDVAEAVREWRTAATARAREWRERDRVAPDGGGGCRDAG